MQPSSGPRSWLCGGRTSTDASELTPDASSPPLPHHPHKLLLALLWLPLRWRTGLKSPWAVVVVSVVVEVVVAVSVMVGSARVATLEPLTAFPHQLIHASWPSRERGISQVLLLLLLCLGRTLSLPRSPAVFAFGAGAARGLCVCMCVCVYVCVCMARGTPALPSAAHDDCCAQSSCV